MRRREGRIVIPAKAGIQAELAFMRRFSGFPLSRE
jgi:hypothetical protein